MSIELLEPQTTTAHLFPSEDWVLAWRAALNQSSAYRDAAATWTYGAIAMVVHPTSADAEPFCVWLDVDQGRCHGARQVTYDEALTAPFCLLANYARWKQVLKRRLDPIAGMVTRRLELRGDLLTMMRYVRSAQAMVRCATEVNTSFIDEEER